MKEWLMVGVGGLLGSMARHGIHLLSIRFLGTNFPFGTLIVNVIGCFLIGIGWSVAEQKGWTNGPWELAYRVGFLGGLTTFSTYGLDIFKALAQQRFAVGFAILVAHLLLGLAMVSVGIWLGNSILTRSVSEG